MKKFLKIFAIGLGVVFLLLLVLPFVFKDKIAAEVQKALDEKLDARVVLEPSNISLSLIRHFPDFSLAIENFGIINKAPFEGDTLLYAREFEVTVDFMSVIGGGQIKVRNIGLEGANLNVFVLPDGRANYNIVKPSADTVQEAPGEPSKFALKIEGWALKEVNVLYIDGTSGTQVGLKGLNHSGSGDFTQELVDVKTKTEIKDLSVTLDSVNYLAHRKFLSELAIAWNMKDQKGIFGDNFVQLNDFRFSFSGGVDVGGEKPTFDLRFASNQNEIKNLLSLVPALYTKDFDKISAEGKLQFEGMVKGFYDSTSLPEFTAKLLVQNGKFKYPDLPKSIENLNVDVAVSHAQGSVEQLQTTVKTFGLKLGENPFSLTGTVVGVSVPTVDVQASGKINLADVLTAFPLEGKELRGLLSLAITAKGTYNQATKAFPALTASLNFSDGYVKTKELPEALEALHFDVAASNPNGQMAATVIDLKEMGFRLANEPFTVKALVKNLDDIQYDVAAAGTVDLAKMTKIFPLEGMTLAGLVKADLKTAGRMSDVTAKNYDKLPTSGVVDVKQFVYTAKDLTKPIQISAATASFTSKEASLTNLQMQIGGSDFGMKGSVKNYLAYVLRNETVQGNLQLTSKLLNTNELMQLTGEPKPEDKKAAEPMQVVALPANIDFGFSCAVGKILYDNMVLENATGAMHLKNGILQLEKLKFNTLEGAMGMAGKYNPTNLQSPLFDMDMDMQNVSIPKAYTTFNSIQAMAPAAKGINGKFSAQMKLGGKLTQQMTADLPTINGGGVIKISEAQLKDIKIVAGINSLAKTKLPTESNVKDLTIKTTIENGRVNFEPFDVNIGGQKLTMSGSNGLDATIDYRIKTAVPAGAAGTAVAGALSAFTGQAITSPKDVKFEIGATGPAASPKYRIVSVDAGNLKNDAKTAVNEKINQAKAEAEAKARAEVERVKAEAAAKAKAETERLKKEADQKAKEELKKLKDKFKF